MNSLILQKFGQSPLELFEIYYQPRHVEVQDFISLACVPLN